MQVKSLLNQPLPNCPKVPKQNKLFKLDRLHPPSGIFISLQEDLHHLDFVKTVLGIIRNSEVKIPVTILVDSSLQSFAYEQFGLERDAFVNIVNLATDDATWAQDYFENAHKVNSWTPSIVDIPYTAESTEPTTYAIGTYCKLDITKHPIAFVEGVDPDENAGDYGGNIESYPGGILVIGSNMQRKMQAHLAASFSQPMHVVNLDWLSPGHVDELFSILPIPRQAGEKCSYALAYASVEKAIELLGEKFTIESMYDHIDEKKVASEELPTLLRNKQNTFCLRNVKNKKQTSYCKRFWQYNRMLEKKVDHELSRLLTVLKQKDSGECKLEKVIPFPLLFTLADEENFDRAKKQPFVSFTENFINNVSLGEHLILPQHSVSSFDKYIKETLKEFSFKLHFADVNFLHNQYGGYHCNTNVMRTCKP